MRRPLISIALAVVAAIAATRSTRADECPLAKRQRISATQVATEHPNIVQTAAGAKDFSTLVAAVKAAGLAETLSGKGPFTVFAPTNEAFEKLPKGTVESLLKPENKKQLAAILTYHVVAGAVESPEAMKLSKAKTVQGADVPLKVVGDHLTVGGAKVVKADLVCSNGVIHVIDTVLMPPADQPAAKATGDIVDVAMDSKDFSTLVAAVKAAGLVETLKGKGPFTVFAPNNAAFAKLPKGTVEGLLKPDAKKQLSGILTYHVVPGKVMAADVVKMSKAKTVQGTEVQIDAGAQGVMINNAKVVKADIECGNGVIHVIDSVLMPE